MEFTPDPSSIFSKRFFFTRTNDKKRLGNTLRGRCTFFLAQNKYNKEAKKNPRLTQYIWLARALARPIFAKN